MHFTSTFRLGWLPNTGQKSRKIHFWVQLRAWPPKLDANWNLGIIDGLHVSLPVKNIQFMTPFTALSTLSQWLRHHNREPACKKYSVYCPIYCVAMVATLQYTEPAYTEYLIHGPIYCRIHRARPQYREPACTIYSIHCPTVLQWLRHRIHRGCGLLEHF
jgi:hypothetical protein